MTDAAEGKSVTPAQFPPIVDKDGLIVVSMGMLEAPEPRVALLLAPVEVVIPVVKLLLAECYGPAPAPPTTPLSTISATVYVH